jgi:hypothetical protein
VHIRWSYEGDQQLVLHVDGATRDGDTDEPVAIEEFRTCRSTEPRPAAQVVAAVECIVDDHSRQQATVRRTSPTTLEATVVVEGTNGERLADGPYATFTIDAAARVVADPVPARR